MNIETVGGALKEVRGDSVTGARERTRAEEQLRARAPDAEAKAASNGVEQNAAASMDRQELESKLADMEERLEASGVSLKFRLREESGDLQVEVLDSESEKVVRKIPPDELIKLSATLEEQAGGFLNRAL